MRLRELRRKVNWLKNQFRSKALILLYHRAAEVETDPQLMSVSPHNLSRQLEYLVRNYRVTSLEDLAGTQVGGNNISDRAVAVTFDDGYADNLISAKPLLERFNVPSTVFVTSGALAQDCEFWWDELERIFLYPSKLPRILRLEMETTVYERDLAEAALYTNYDFARYRTWDVQNSQVPTVRHAVYRDLCAILRRLVPTQRAATMRAIREWSGTPKSVRGTHRGLTPDEVKDLVSGGAVRVGAHTVSHAVLSALPLNDQHWEILESRDQLTKILGTAPGSFAYPFGARTDYTRETVGLVRAAGFSLACANFPDVVTAGADTFQLPRMIVRNWDQETFAGMLENWFQGRA